jgi:hypothetical protein
VDPPIARLVTVREAGSSPGGCLPHTRRFRVTPPEPQKTQGIVLLTTLLLVLGLLVFLAL